MLARIFLFTGASLTGIYSGCSDKRGDHMGEEMECMCQQCGISTYLPAELISLENPANTEVKLLSHIHACENCGGQLALVGKAGDEPHYRLE
jgi:Zn finger protein HypA/HybF involved in hydrogenase expression